MGEIRNAHKILVVKYISNPPFGTPRKKWGTIIKYMLGIFFFENQRLPILTRIISSVFSSVKHCIAAVFLSCSLVGVINIRDVPDKRKSLNSVN
jgi:hypothetical protein